ncbi:transforming growth factor-beta-induced protein ig-h3-like [Babylonia areolata]|uniref:transforming growth factor-beta-induced protein ig-h3-like n=1 Tax=Babylonia areolata TaxID=304850 RepID=UPI003FD1F690
MSWLVFVALLMGLLSATEGATTLGHAVSGTTIRELLRNAGLMDTLNNEGPFTLFLPSDMYLLRFFAAHNTNVADLEKDPVALKQFLLFHVVNGTISRDQLYNERMLTALSGQKIRVNSYVDGRLTVQGVPLQSRSQTATNGIIYYTYGPLLPANGTVTDVISSESDLSTLMTAAHAAGMDEFLADQNPVTLFAPTNAAFSALGDDKVNSLLANPELLAEILQYHVVPGTLYSVGIHDSELPTFEANDKLHLTSQFGQGTIEGGHLVRNGVDMSAFNGVVHKIDRVLIPESLKSQI